MLISLSQMDLPNSAVSSNYSALAYALEAKSWANDSGTVTDAAGDDTGEKSAKTLAGEASDDADAAAASAAAAAVSAEQAIGSNTISAGTGIDITVTGSGPYDNEIDPQEDGRLYT